MADIVVRGVNAVAVPGRELVFEARGALAVPPGWAVVPACGAMPEFRGVNADVEARIAQAKAEMDVSLDVRVTELLAQIDGLGTGLYSERIARQSGDESIAARIDTEVARLDDNVAAARQGVIVNADKHSALVQSFQTFAAKTDSSLAAAASEITVLAEESRARAEEIDRLAVSMDGREAAYGEAIDLEVTQNYEHFYYPTSSDELPTDYAAGDYLRFGYDYDADHPEGTVMRAVADCGGTWNIGDWTATGESEPPPQYTAASGKIESLEAKVDGTYVKLASTEAVIAGYFKIYSGGTPKIGNIKIDGDAVWQYLGGNLGTNQDGWVKTDEDAKKLADFAHIVANNADSKANTAISTANNADGKANTAINKANTADGKANNAINTANTADSKANTAINKANTASTWAAGASKLITNPDGIITGWSFGDGSSVKSEFAIFADKFRIVDTDNNARSLFDNGAWRTYDSRGNYSELSSGSLKFLKADGSVDYYVKRIQVGKARSGDRVTLTGFTGRAPTIIVSPADIQTYRRLSDTQDQALVCQYEDLWGSTSSGNFYFKAAAYLKLKSGNRTRSGQLTGKSNDYSAAGTNPGWANTTQSSWFNPGASSIIVDGSIQVYGFTPGWYSPPTKIVQSIFVQLFGWNGSSWVAISPKRQISWSSVYGLGSDMINHAIYLRSSTYVGNITRVRVKIYGQLIRTLTDFTQTSYPNYMLSWNYKPSSEWPVTGGCNISGFNVTFNYSNTSILTPGTLNWIAIG